MAEAQQHPVASGDKSMPLSGELDPSAVGGTTGDLPQNYYRSSSFIGTFTAVCLGLICSQLGFVLPANTLPLINADIGPSPAVVWVALVWTLALSLGYTLVGRLSDIIGRRWFYIGGNALGLLGTIIAATAQNINVLIFASALIGAASAVQLTFPVIIGELIPNRHRVMASGTMLLTALPVSVFGPVIARAFITHTSAGWRWSYYLNIITSSIAVGLYFFFYHPPSFQMLHAQNQSKITIWSTLDFGGIVLFLSGLTLFLLGISWGGQQYPWADGRVIGAIVGGFALLCGFVLYEIFAPVRYPLLPMRLFRSWKYISIVTTAAVGSMIYYSMCVLWPNQVSSLYTSDLMNIGWLSLTVGAGTLLGQVVGGALCEPLGHQRWQMTIGCVGMTGFVGALAASSQTTKSMAIVLTLLGSFCVGWVEVVALVTAPLCHEQEDIGLAYGVSGTLKAGSGSIATSIYSTILSNKMATNIPKYVRPAALGAGLPLSSMPELLAAVASGEFSAVKGVNPHIISVVTEAYKTACSESFKIVYLASIAFGGLAIIAALWSPNMEHKLNDEVARRLHGKGIAENNLGHAELKNLGVEQLEVVHS